MLLFTLEECLKEHLAQSALVFKLKLYINHKTGQPEGERAQLDAVLGRRQQRFGPARQGLALYSLYIVLRVSVVVREGVRQGGLESVPFEIAEERLRIAQSAEGRDPVG